MYIKNIQNLVDTNTKKDLKKKLSKIVSKFDDIEQSFIKNTATAFFMSLVNLQDGFNNKDFTTDLAFEICKRKELKEIFNNEEDIKKVFEAYTIHFALYCKEEPQDVENVFGIVCKNG